MQETSSMVMVPRPRSWCCRSVFALSYAVWPNRHKTGSFCSDRICAPLRCVQKDRNYGMPLHTGLPEQCQPKLLGTQAQARARCASQFPQALSEIKQTLPQVDVIDHLCVHIVGRTVNCDYDSSETGVCFYRAMGRVWMRLVG